MTTYTDFITSEHADKPKFVGMVDATCQPFVDAAIALSLIPAMYDVDRAVGQQLDVVGQWVGVTRMLETPLEGVYFSLDTEGVGLDEGVWKGPYDPDTGLTRLPDEYYRTLIKVRILNNHWDGSMGKAYELASAVFASFGIDIFIVDHGDLTMSLGLLGGVPTPLEKGLLTSGKFNIRPAGVGIRNYLFQSTSGPMFAFDLDNDNFAGLDVGGWATVTTI